MEKDLQSPSQLPPPPRPLARSARLGAVAAALSWSAAASRLLLILTGVPGARDLLFGQDTSGWMSVPTALGGFGLVTAVIALLSRRSNPMGRRLALVALIPPVVFTVVCVVLVIRMLGGLSAEDLR